METFLFAISHDLLIRMSWKFTFVYSKHAVWEKHRKYSTTVTALEQDQVTQQWGFLPRKSRYLQDSSLQLSASTISLECRWCGSVGQGGCSSLRQTGEWWKALDHVTLGLAALLQQLQSDEDSPVKGVNMSHVAVSACKFSSHLYRELILTVAQSK